MPRLRKAPMFAISLLACAAGALGDATAQQPAKIPDTIEQRMAAEIDALWEQGAARQAGRGDQEKRVLPASRRQACGLPL